MLYRERRQGLRLEIDHEANALILDSGANAYSIACQRAKEASSDEIANDWNRVAAAIGRRTGKRPSWLAHVFHWIEPQSNTARSDYPVSSALKSAA